MEGSLFLEIFLGEGYVQSPHKSLYMDIHRSFIQNGQKVNISPNIHPLIKYSIVVK